jgi:acyl-coenzyme A synthetase/AMP-(fatty) acid ligase
MEVSQGVIGELVYSGPNVAMGYAGSSADLSREAEFGDTLRTGDLAVLEADGFLRIVGRRNRFVKIFGNRVNLDDVEEMVTSVGLQAACTGIDDKITVHVIHSGDFDLALLQNLVAKFIGAHKNSIEIKQISKIPRSESGKVLYSVLIGGSNDN